MDSKNTCFVLLFLELIKAHYITLSNEYNKIKGDNNNYEPLELLENPHIELNIDIAKDLYHDQIKYIYQQHKPNEIDNIKKIIESNCQNVKQLHNKYSEHI